MPKVSRAMITLQILHISLGQYFEDLCFNPQLSKDQKLSCLNFTDSCALLLPTHPSRLENNSWISPRSFPLPYSQCTLPTSLLHSHNSFLPPLVLYRSLPVMAPFLDGNFSGKNQAYAFEFIHLF